MSSNEDSPPPSDNYRKPPVEYQFKKGKTGNGKGRPPKKKEADSSMWAGGIADRLAAMALEEATRLVTVRENDKTSELPAMQAMLRTLFRSGAQGDIKAARQLLELIGRAEAGRTRIARENLEYTVEYKRSVTPVFEKYQKEGLDPPEIYPHPDDLIIDHTRGEVTTDGPASKEQAGAQEVVRKQALQLLPRYFEVEVALQKDPTNKALKQEFKELKRYHEFFKWDANRTLRHQVAQMSRAALEPKPQEPSEAVSGPEHDNDE